MRPLAAVAAVTVIIITMVVVPGRDKPLPHASAGLGKPALQPQPRFLASLGMTPARGLRRFRQQAVTRGQGAAEAQGVGVTARGDCGRRAGGDALR